ncbi:MAG: MoaD/ThiS family protein [Chloroflexi bacterium]|nr:MoaD/ThiS family protein [Chloroflexota bacterium]
MAKLRLTSVLRSFVGGNASVEVEAATVGALGDEIRHRYPALADRLFDKDGQWGDFVSVFVDGTDARYLGADAPIASEVQILPAISGG